jgi:NAD(P)-dependent dehydrogenase (short-subunit alcohol dehydrogenase family)
MKLKNRVALVTGVGDDVGRAVAFRFAAEGAKVVIAGRRSADVEASAAMTREIGNEATPLTVDLSDPSAIREMVSTAVTTYGGLDILYNIPGEITLGEREGDDYDKTWNAVMAVTLRRFFLCCKYGLPELMKGGNGVVINQVTRGILPETNSEDPSILCAYHSAKTGTIALTNKIAYAFGPAGIRAVSVIPGVTEASLRETRENRAWHSKMVETIPLRRVATPEDVAQVALFFASDASSYVSGTTLWVDGAYTFSHRGAYP